MATQTELPDQNGPTVETPRRGRPPGQKAAKKLRRNFAVELATLETKRGVALMLLRNLPVTDATKPIIESISDLLSSPTHPEHS